MKALYLVLSLGFALFSGPVSAEMEYKIPITKEDFLWLKNNVNSLPSNQRQNAEHFIFRCEPGHCRVTCQPDPEFDAPERTKHRPMGCFLNFREVNIDAYLTLIEEAKADGHPHPGNMATCDSQGCLLSMSQ